MVLDAQDLVHHGLVRPLVEEGREGVVTAIQDQQHGSDVGVEGKEIAFSPHHQLLRVLRDRNPEGRCEVQLTAISSANLLVMVDFSLYLERKKVKSSLVLFHACILIVCCITKMQLWCICTGNCRIFAPKSESEI